MSTPLLELLREQLATARAYDEEVAARNRRGSIINIPGIGQNISNAYEQLRKAAESVEEHLLLQRAIRRFLNRSLTFSAHKKPKGVGGELILELTHAGYLTNNSVSNDTAKAITGLVQESLEVYRQLTKARVPRILRIRWLLDLLSVEIETLLNPNHRMAAVAYVAHQHYLQLLPRHKLTRSEDEERGYEVCLYIAVHQALLKSDMAIVRHNLMRMYHQTPEDLAAFIEFNKALDEAFTSRLTQRIKRAVNRYGAPFRIIRSMSDERPDLPELLGNRETFLDAYNHQIRKDYRNVTKRLRRGIIKSIVFIFVTKVSVGLAVEIPYDLLALGEIALLPLLINLLFPPLYMASFGLRLHPPRRGNAAALRTYIDQALYYGLTPTEQAVRVATKPISNFAKFWYTLLFLVPLGLTIYVLTLLDFNVVQGLIFFIFLCTASFLGFRLSRMTRELELIHRETRFSGALRDFFYLPFIIMGQWISSRYSRLNIVANALDVLVELPLKSVLRLIRQWTRFLNEKHEEIY